MNNLLLYSYQYRKYYIWFRYAVKNCGRHSVQCCFYHLSL